MERIKGIIILSWLGLVSSGLTILIHLIFIWGCISALGGIFILSILEVLEDECKGS